MAYTASKRDAQAPNQLPDLLVVDVSPTDSFVLTPKQLRAARALVGWSREALADKSAVPAITTKQFENGDTDPRLSTLHKWRRALEAAGVMFIDPDEENGPGVRLRKRNKR